MTAAAIEEVWLLSLGVGLVVFAGLAGLLAAILFETKRIHAAVSAIWDGGRRVTTHLVHLSLLADTTYLVGATAEAAGRLSAAIEPIGADAPDLAAPSAGSVGETR